MAWHRACAFSLSLVLVLACGRIGYHADVDAAGRDANMADTGLGPDGGRDASMLDACVPRTCVSAAAECGEILDGCGDPVSCGACPTDESCGAMSPNQCGVGTCVPTTCDASGTECGDISDGCSEVITCEPCMSGSSCVKNVCVLDPPGCAVVGWTFEPINEGSASTLDLQLDASWNPHVAYEVSSSAWYATREATGWLVEMVDGTSRAARPRLAVSGTIIHMVYYDGGPLDRLLYARREVGWVLSSPDSAGDVGWDPSIALIGDHVHILYYKDYIPLTGRIGDFRHAILRPAMAPVITDVDTTGFVGEYSATVSAGSTLHVSYYDSTNGDLRYAQLETAPFIATVDSTGDVGRQTSIASRDEVVHIAYFDLTNTALKVATRVIPSAIWTIETVETAGVTRVGRIDVDGLGRVHVSYATAAGTHHARRDTSGWSTSLVSSTPGASSLAVEDDGRVHMVLHEGTVLTYAVGCPP